MTFRKLIFVNLLLFLDGINGNGLGILIMLLFILGDGIHAHTQL